jgi:hypothetical protein
MSIKTPSRPRRVREFFHVQQTTWPGASNVPFIYNSNRQYSLTESRVMFHCLKALMAEIARSPVSTGTSTTSWPTSPQIPTRSVVSRAPSTWSHTQQSPAFRVDRVNKANIQTSVTQFTPRLRWPGGLCKGNVVHPGGFGVMRGGLGVGDHADAAQHRGGNPQDLELPGSLLRSADYPRPASRARMMAWARSAT